MVEQVDVVGHGEGSIDVLLNEEQGCAFGDDGGQELEDPVHDKRR